MLDVEYGIFLPRDAHITLYYPSRVHDVIERLIRDNQPVYEYMEYSDHINLCAIKYDKVESLIKKTSEHYTVHSDYGHVRFSGTKLNSEYMRQILRYNAVKCMRFYMANLSTDTVRELFWENFSGRDIEKNIYEIATEDTYVINSLWLFQQDNSEECRNAVRNVITWMGRDKLLENIYTFSEHMDIVISVYGLDTLIKHHLCDPSSLLDELICAYICTLPVEDRERVLSDTIDRCLKDDNVIYNVVDNIRNISPSDLSTISIYAGIKSHNDVKYLLN